MHKPVFAELPVLISVRAKPVAGIVMPLVGARTLEANHYLESEFMPWWNQRLVVAPASGVDAHRPLGPEHDLAAIVSTVGPAR